MDDVGVFLHALDKRSDWPAGEAAECHLVKILSLLIFSSLTRLRSSLFVHVCWTRAGSELMAFSGLNLRLFDFSRLHDSDAIFDASLTMH